MAKAGKKIVEYRPKINLITSKVKKIKKIIFFPCRLASYRKP